MAAERSLHVLTAEHRTFEGVLSVLEFKAQEIDRQPFPLEFFEQTLDFLANFADRCHLPKEEERLFPLLWEKGVPLEKGPLGAMMDEHQISRRILAAIRVQLPAAAQGAPEAAAAVRTEIADYVHFMRQHMQKEEQRIFNVARSLLDSHDAARLEREFEEVENEQIGPAFHKRYEGLAARLRESAHRRN